MCNYNNSVFANVLCERKCPAMGIKGGHRRLVSFSAVSNLGWYGIPGDSACPVAEDEGCMHSC